MTLHVGANQTVDAVTVSAVTGNCQMSLTGVQLPLSAAPVAVDPLLPPPPAATAVTRLEVYGPDHTVSLQVAANSTVTLPLSVPVSFVSV